MSYKKRISSDNAIISLAALYLCGLVLRGGNEVRPVSRPLKICNGHIRLVNLGVVKLLPSLTSISQLFFGISPQHPYLRIILGDSSVLMACNYILRQITPASHGSLRLLASDGQDLLIRLLRLRV